MSSIDYTLLYRGKKVLKKCLTKLKIIAIIKKREQSKGEKMTIREFIAKHGRKYNISYSSLHRLIQIGALKENIHYVKSYRAVRCKFVVNEQKLIQYLETGETR